MSELIVVAFDEPSKADEVLNELRTLQKGYLIDLEDAVVAVRRSDGKVQLKQSVNLVGMSAASGGLWGALWGTLDATRKSPQRLITVSRPGAAHFLVARPGGPLASSSVGHCCAGD